MNEDYFSLEGYINKTAYKPARNKIEQERRDNIKQKLITFQTLRKDLKTLEALDESEQDENIKEEIISLQKKISKIALYCLSGIY